MIKFKIAMLGYNLVNFLMDNLWKISQSYIVYVLKCFFIRLKRFLLLLTAKKQSKKEKMWFTGIKVCKKLANL